MFRILALCCLAAPAWAQDAPDPDVPPAAVVIRLEGVTLSIDAVEVEIALGAEDLARVLTVLEGAKVEVEGNVEGN